MPDRRRSFPPLPEPDEAPHLRWKAPDPEFVPRPAPRLEPERRLSTDRAVLPGGIRDEERVLYPEEVAFAREYLVDYQPVSAAIRAGYPARVAEQSAARLLADPDVKALLLERIAEIDQRTGVSADRTRRELARIGYSDIGRVATWDEDGGVHVIPSERLQDDDRAAIASVKDKSVTTVHETLDSEGHVVERVTTTTHNVEVKMHDKLKAINTLAKHVKLIHDGPEVVAVGLGAGEMAQMHADNILIALRKAAQGELGPGVVDGEWTEEDEDAEEGDS